MPPAPTLGGATCWYTPPEHSRLYYVFDTDSVLTFIIRIANEVSYMNDDSLAAQAFPSCQGTTSDDEDSYSATDWSIANKGLWHQGADMDSKGGR